MSLTAHVVHRALSALVLAVVAASAALLLTLRAPANITFEDADLSAAEREQRLELLGLKRPLIEQYLDWLGKVVRLDFGESLKYQRPVADLLRERIVNTAILATTALAIATLLGIPLGIFTAANGERLAARVVRWGSLVLLSTPPLLASLVLLMVAGRTRWLPTGGMTSATLDTAATSWLLDVATHVVLPALALGLPLAAHLERLQSHALADVAREPFVRAACARGLSPAAALLRHGWRASLRGVLGVYGLMIGALFSGSFIVEVVTAWPGLGRLMLDALLARDLYLVAGCAAAAAGALALGTFVSDVLLALADPRARGEANA